MIRDAEPLYTPEERVHTTLRVIHEPFAAAALATATRKGGGLSIQELAYLAGPLLQPHGIVSDNPQQLIPKLTEACRKLAAARLILPEVPNFCLPTDQGEKTVTALERYCQILQTELTEDIISGCTMTKEQIARQWARSKVDLTGEYMPQALRALKVQSEAVNISVLAIIARSNSTIAFDSILTQMPQSAPLTGAALATVLDKLTKTRFIRADRSTDGKRVASIGKVGVAAITAYNRYTETLLAA